MSGEYPRLITDDGEIELAPEYLGMPLADWFEMAGDRQALSGGRGSVQVVRTPIGALVRREYRRGGLPRHFLRDRYLWIGENRVRSLREFRLLRRLHQRGLAVPEAIAAGFQRIGIGYRAALLTRLVPDAHTLRARLADGESPERLLPLVATEIAALHAVGVWHADLNADNILIDGDDKVWLIDFDRAREGVDDRRRLAGNVERLLRSLRKHLPGDRLALLLAAWPAFVEDHERALAALSSQA